MSEFLKYLRKNQYRIDRYDNEAYTRNPLLKFRLSEIKERRHSEHIKRKAASVRKSLK